MSVRFFCLSNAAGSDNWRTSFETTDDNEELKSLARGCSFLSQLDDADTMKEEEEEKEEDDDDDEKAEGFVGQWIFFLPS